MPRMLPSFASTRCEFRACRGPRVSRSRATCGGDRKDPRVCEWEWRRMAARVAESRKYCGTVVEMNFLSRDTQRFVLRTIAVGNWQAIRRYMSNRVEAAWLPEGLLNEEQRRAFAIKNAGDKRERQPLRLELGYADTSKFKRALKRSPPAIAE